MTIAQESQLDAEELHTLVREYRALLDRLEQRLHAHTTASASRPSEALVQRVTPDREARIARNEVRRAARRAPRGVDPVWVARPAGGVDLPGRDELAEVAGARGQTWRRADDAWLAIKAGDVGAAEIALDEIVQTEVAMQAVVDAVRLPDSWHDVAYQLSRAGDTVIEAAREARAALRRDPADGGIGPVMARLRTGQSAWLQAWRTFIQVAPVRPQG